MRMIMCNGLFVFVGLYMIIYNCLQLFYTWCDYFLCVYTWSYITKLRHLTRFHSAWSYATLNACAKLRINERKIDIQLYKIIYNCLHFCRKFTQKRCLFAVSLHKMLSGCRRVAAFRYTWSCINAYKCSSGCCPSCMILCDGSRLGTNSVQK